jgi:hypothetical protein
METNYPEVVYEIHNEFLTSGDKLLAEAEAFLKNPPKVSEQKVNRLKQLGFTKTVDVKKPDEIKAATNKNQALMTAITDFKIKYPNYKFITEDVVKQICDKYGLVMGGVTQFKGFVPEKNLNDIEFFFFTHPELKVGYYKFDWDYRQVQITKEEFESLNKEKPVATKSNFASIGYDPFRKSYWKDNYRSQRNSLQNGLLSQSLAMQQLSPQLLVTTNSQTLSGLNSQTLNSQPPVSTIKKDVTLSICAPLNQMDVQGYVVIEGYKLVYDPIVLCPLRHNNGVSGYLVVTAWGDEANDELVVDQSKN